MDLDLSLYLVLDPVQCGGHARALELTRAALDGGVTIVQLRAPEWHKRAWLELALDLLPLTRRYGVPLIINDHVDVVLAAGADGVHIGQNDLPPDVARKLLGARALIGLSVSNALQVDHANTLGAMIDYVGAGPVFDTPTKPDASAASSCTTPPMSNARDRAVSRWYRRSAPLTTRISPRNDCWHPPENHMTHSIPNVLTIAGSDSGGGAGIQADLKAFSALGAYGLSVITALTAQNTRGVTAIHTPDASFVTAQLDAVFDDIRIDAVKIGMLANADVVRAVAAALLRYRPVHVVLDTVMISKSHHALLAPDAVAALRDELLPLATLVTPNLPEAAALLNVASAEDEDAMVRQGEALRALGARAVLMKGGHLSSADSPDWLIEESGSLRLGGPRVPVKNTHGTGCTLSSSIAALLPQRDSLAAATADAKLYLTGAIEQSARLDVGHGIGPVHHFFKWW